MKKLLSLLVLFILALMSFHQAQGQVLVSGSVYEQDSISPIEGASVVFSGVDVFGDTVDYQFVTDTLGRYGDGINYGKYWISACAEGYECAFLSDSLQVGYDSLVVVSDINLVLYEIRFPVRYVAARPYNTDLVRLSWSMHDPLLYEDFESGDFSGFNWNNSLSMYPWVITDDDAYEGDYCIRSTCEGVGDGVSQIEVPVYIPSDGEMSFYCRISSESNWDVGSFYLDGVKKMEVSGETDWTRYAFAVTEGEHLFRWSYQKDASTDMGDDCFYVDCIRFCQEDTTDAKPLQRSFRYFELFRRRTDESPVLLASHLTDTVFMETNWGNLSWGQYTWGVSCYYEGNRYASDTVWSVFLDKDMTTTLEVNITTNVGLYPAGAVVTLLSHDGQEHNCQAVADADGHVLMTNVYRGLYDLHIHLDGYVDYVSSEPLPIFEPQQADVELKEAYYGIAGFYVSYTGYAMWQLGDPLNRDLQYFELKLNEQVVGVTTETSFQFDVSGLSSGELCVAKVRPVYLSETGDWYSVEWVYWPCYYFQGSGGLQWSLSDNAVLLSWDIPDNISYLGSLLYRDGEYVGFMEGNTFLDETVEMHGEVKYCVSLVYDGPMDGTYYSISCEECVSAVFPSYCDPPVKLEAENYLNNENDFGALISWGERPPTVQQWLHYDDGEFKRALGGDNEPIVFWSIRFEAEELEEYIGCSLQRISIFDVGAGIYQLWVYVGGDTAPRTLVWSQNMTLHNAHDWHEESVPAIEIPENEPLWIVVGQQGLSRPAAACTDMGNPNGRWVSLDGEHWTDMYTFNMHYTWMLRAFVTNQVGRMLPLDESGYSLQHYNLFRSYDNVDYQQIAVIPAVEGQAFYQYRDVLVDEDHSAFYYRLTAVYLSDEGETCESGFATSLNDPEAHFVYVDDHWSTEEMTEISLKLYPNPSNGQITIEQEGMQMVAVYNTLGQLLFSKEVDGNCLQLDLSEFGNGLYWMRIHLQNGVVTRSFVLSR